MEDSVKGIYKTVSDCAEISAGAGGIGLCISKLDQKTHTYEEQMENLMELYHYVEF